MLSAPGHVHISSVGYAELDTSCTLCVQVIYTAPDAQHEMYT